MLMWWLMLLCTPVWSTHIVGGEVYYDCLGGDQYRITVKVYRDCSPNNNLGTGFDQPAPIAIFNGDGTLFRNLSVYPSSITNVPVIINDPCLQAPPNLCMEVATYEATTTIPPSTQGYNIVYQRCCRNPSTINIVNSSTYGASYTAHIPSSSLGSGCNNSPRFTTLPPLVICNGSDFQFDHSATDPDGDSLVYSFYTPFHGANNTNPAPNPPSPPPFSPVIWAGGANVNQQIPGNPPLSIDILNGELTCSPNISGLYVYGIRVSEYRNGVMLSEAYREFQTTVTNCPSVVVSSIQSQQELCAGPTITIANNSTNASSFYWDFGDPNHPNNTSTLTSPTHTFSDTGTFTIMLIANPGFSCADTSYSTYTVHLPLDPEFVRPDPQCISNNAFDLLVTGNFTPAAVATWDFGPLATPSTYTGQNPQQIHFSDSGYHVVTVTLTQFGCTASYTDTLVVFPLPEIGFSYPPQAGCEPYTVQFTDTSFSWTPLSYLWNFGDGNYSNQQHPEHTYLNHGIYDVSLTISVDSICVFSTTLDLPGIVEVYPTPRSRVTANPMERDVFTPRFTFYDRAIGHTWQVIRFEDLSETTSPEYTRVFFESGYHTAWQYVINDYGCTDSSYVTVYVSPYATMYVPNAFTPDGDGINDIFLPIGLDVSEYTLLIYDRWGQEIFVTNDTRQGWDGTRNGKLCPVDTYVYLILYHDHQHIQREVRGHFTLVR